MDRWFAEKNIDYVWLWRLTEDAERRWRRGGTEVYLHFKKGRTKRWPLVNDLQEGKFGFFSGFSSVFVVEGHYGLREKHSHLSLEVKF